MEFPRRSFAVLGLGVLGVSAHLDAQDPVPPIDQGVRVGITYTPGVRPGMLVLGGERAVALDSIRVMLRRDLDFSDAFEMISLPMGDSLVLRIGRGQSDTSLVGGGEGGSRPEFVNYGLYAALGADYAVDVRPIPDSTVGVSLFDVRGATRQREVVISIPDLAAPDFRMAVHRAADEVVRSATGVAGNAATRLLFINRGRIYRVDADGAGVEAISPTGVEAMSPIWSPGGTQAVYMEFPGRLYVHDIRSGTRQLVPPTSEYQNFAPGFSPDGETIAFSRANDEGTDIYTYNLADQCCLQRLTVGRLFDNLSPTFSPDGRRIAFVSNRPGQTQIYVMASDGTGQELFAPFDWGVTGSSNAPEWSPDGLSVAFHREVARIPQVFVMDVATRTVRQLTSAGRNSDPTWGPDGRHMAFVSDRTGSRQVWIIDMETGRVRQLTRLGQARLPSWSMRIESPN